MPASSRVSATSLLLLTVLSAGCSRGSAEQAPAPQAAPERPAANVATVRSETIDQAPKESIEKILEGRIAGVMVSRTADGGIAVRIRGASSFHGNNDPLYILDGVPVEPGPNGSLTGINPYDIESIKVLKSAAEVALYGARGANGVVVIKTKKATTPKPDQ